jgi:hypothetical protein
MNEVALSADGIISFGNSYYCIAVCNDSDLRLVDDL